MSENGYLLDDLLKERDMSAWKYFRPTSGGLANDLEGNNSLSWCPDSWRMLIDCFWKSDMRGLLPPSIFAELGKWRVFSSGITNEVFSGWATSLRWFRLIVGSSAASLRKLTCWPCNIFFGGRTCLFAFWTCGAF